MTNLIKRKKAERRFQLYGIFAVRFYTVLTSTAQRCLNSDFSKFYTTDLLEPFPSLLTPFFINIQTHQLNHLKKLRQLIPSPRKSTHLTAPPHMVLLMFKSTLPALALISTVVLAALVTINRTKRTLLTRPLTIKYHQSAVTIQLKKTRTSKSTIHNHSLLILQLLMVLQHQRQKLHNLLSHLKHQLHCKYIHYL